MITRETVLNESKKIKNILESQSLIVDNNNTFPEQGINALKERNFMELVIPKKFGGLEQDIKTISDVAQILAGGCLSTSMIWGMHCQQVMTIINHSKELLKEKILTDISKKKLYLASVTSEYSKGGHLLTSDCPLEWIDDDMFNLNRDAPTVTGGLYADAYLITAKKDKDSPPTNVKLVYANKEDLRIDLIRDWKAMGMRGTQSVSMRLSGTLNRNNIMSSDEFDHIAQQTIIPFGHIMWVSSWLGAAKSALKKQIKIIKKNFTRKYKNNPNTNILYHRLSEVRLKIDTVDMFLSKVIEEYKEVSRVGNFKSNRFNINVNSLKILGSENLFRAIDQLIDIAGMYHGYLENDEIQLERTFRDLRSASLMYHNDRLKLVNGKISLYDTDIIP